MADIDLSVFEARRCQRKPCAVADALSRLSDGDRELFEAGLAADTRRYPTGRIQHVLAKEHGIDVSIAAITSHRSKRCLCAYDA